MSNSIRTDQKLTAIVDESSDDSVYGTIHVLEKEAHYQTPQVQSSLLADRTNTTSSIQTNPKSAPKGDTDLKLAWLSCELRIDQFNIKNEAFTIMGWINVFWEWDNVPNVLKKNDESKANDHADNPRDSTLYKTSVRAFSTNHTKQLHYGTRSVVDLRDSMLVDKLPIHPDSIFEKTSVHDAEHVEPPMLFYYYKEHIAQTTYHIKAQLLEHLELNRFPFDSQFLNVKIRINWDGFRLMNYNKKQEFNLKIIDFLKAKDRRKETHYDNPIQISVKYTIMKEVEIFDPWIDFRYKRNKNDKEKPVLRFALIKLRVSRKPVYFVTNVLLPFIFIVSSSFAVFAVNDTNARLGILLTVLLTFTAFQWSIAEHLPQTSVILYIDLYILLAYIIQAWLILMTVVIQTGDSLDWNQDAEVRTQIVFGTVSGLVWSIVSVSYLCLGCPCKKPTDDDWKNRAQQELEGWRDAKINFNKYDENNSFF